MFRELLVTALLAVASSPALCQRFQASPASAIPDYIIYDAFFLHVTWLDDVAAQIRAKGNDGSGASSKIAGTRP